MAFICNTLTYLSNLSGSYDILSQYELNSENNSTDFFETVIEDIRQHTSKLSIEDNNPNLSANIFVIVCRCCIQILEKRYFPEDNQVIRLVNELQLTIIYFEKDEKIILIILYSIWLLLPILSRELSFKPFREKLLNLILKYITSEFTSIKKSSFEILSRIAELYPCLLEDHLDLINENILKAIILENNVIIDIAVKFWIAYSNTINFSQLSESNDTSSEYHILKPYLSKIIKALLEILTTQTDDTSEEHLESIEVSKTASEALCLLCKIYQNHAVKLVLPFVEKNIENDKYKFREAALIAFGSCLDNNEILLTPYLNVALPNIVNYLKDDKFLIVKDSVCWVLAGVYEFIPEILFELCIAHDKTNFNRYNHVEHVVPILLDTLDRFPSLAKNASDALCHLLQISEIELSRNEISLISTDPDLLPPVTLSLITYIHQIYSTLILKLKDLQYMHVSRCFSDIICIIVELCPATMIDIIKSIHVESLQITKSLLIPENLKNINDMTVSEAKEYDDYYSSFMAISASCIRKLTQIFAMTSLISNNVVVMLMQIFCFLKQVQVSFDVLPSLYEELLYNLSQIAGVEYLFNTNPLISKAETLQPLIIMILEESFCSLEFFPELIPLSLIEVSLTLLVQLFKLAASSGNLDKYIEQILCALGNCFKAPDFAWQIRPHVCKTIGELIEIIGIKVQPMLDKLMEIFLKAFSHYESHSIILKSSLPDDYDDRFLEHLFDGLSCIFSSLNNSNDTLISYVKTIVKYILEIMNNDIYVGLPSRDVLISTMKLISNMAAIGVLVRDSMTSSDLIDLIEDCQNQDDLDLAASALLAKEQMDYLFNDDV